MLQAAVAVNTALNAADCFGFLPVRGTKLNISGLAKVGCLETDEIQLCDNEKKALCISEGDNEYLCFSTEDGKEMITAEQDMTHNGDLTRTGNTTATGDITATGQISSKKGARGTAGNITAEGDITADGNMSAVNVTASGTVSGATVDATSFTSGGAPVTIKPNSLLNAWSIAREADQALAQDTNTFALKGGTTVAQSAKTFKLEGQAVLDMDKYLQTFTKETSTLAQYKVGVRAAGGDELTTKPTEVAVTGISGMPTTFAGTYIISGSTGTGTTALVASQHLDEALDESRLLIFKDVTIGKAAATLAFAGDGTGGMHAAAGLIIIEDKDGNYTAVYSGNNDHGTVTLTGTDGTNFSGHMFLYANLAANTSSQYVKAYFKVTTGTLSVAVSA
jgi:hypothetical protein